MEDFYETKIDGVDGEIVGLFGVFDGTFLSSPYPCIVSVLLRLREEAKMRD